MLDDDNDSKSCFRAYTYTTIFPTSTNYNDKLQ